MKRTLSVTFAVGGLLLATLTLLLGRQQQMLAMQDARAVEDRVRSDAPSSVILPDEQVRTGPASSGEEPILDALRSETLPPPIDNKVGFGKSRVDRSKYDADIKGDLVVTKTFGLLNADASEVLRLIQPLLPVEAKASVNQQTNSLIVSANADRLVIITALLIALDEAPGTKRLPLPGEPDPKSRYIPPNSSTSNRPAAAVFFQDDQDAAMDREAKQLAARVRAAKEPEKSKLRAELELLTDKHFELRQQRRAAEIAELADRVDKLRVAHHRRQENKPDILKRRLADLLDEENELKWDEARLKTASPITPSKPEPRVPNLDGEWLVTLPAGFEFVGRIEKQPEGCWSFQEMRNLSGYYQLEGNTLKSVTTDKKEPRDYEWLILNDNVLVLTKAPQNIGSDYRGATLRRGGKPKPQNPNGLSGTPSQSQDASAITKTLTRAAQARLRVAEVALAAAEKELMKMQESNRKVAGAIPELELERARLVMARCRADVEIAQAELEAAQTGVDLPRREPPISPPAPAREK